jgi:RNA polymerase sigma-70 factor (ECF subfamily)
MDRVTAGDGAALSEIYTQYGGFVFGLARRVTASPAVAEDVVQDVFASLWERPGAFDASRGSLRSWLGVLTHRRSVDRVRRETAARRREMAEASRQPVAPAEPSDAATSLLVAERVRAAVRGLPDEQRQAVELAYFGGRTYVEVAEVLGIPEGTAKSRLRLALKKLGDELGAEGVNQWA